MGPRLARRQPWRAPCCGRSAWTIISNRSPLDAAIEIDRRFDLRERIASSLSLSPDEQSSEAGRAVVNDALRAVGRIDVDDKFRVRLGRRARCGRSCRRRSCLCSWRSSTTGRHRAASIRMRPRRRHRKPRPHSNRSARKWKSSGRSSTKKKAWRRPTACSSKSNKARASLTEKKRSTRSKAAVKLNDLAKQLEERRQQLGGKDGLKEQFQKMKNLGAGPADKAAEAMKQGDWKKALDEVEKLAKELARRQARRRGQGAARKTNRRK